MPLKIDKNLLSEIISIYDLGLLKATPTLFATGLLNQVGRLETTRGSFVIKILNTSKSLSELQITEDIAQTFKQQDIPALTALTQNQSSMLKLQNKMIMIFPYISAFVLLPEQISSVNAGKIGNIIGKIHQTNIHLPNAPQVEIIPDRYVTEENVNLYPQLLDVFPLIQLIEANLQKQRLILENNTVLSHRDCDPKNVLWDQDKNCYLIDWESAGFINKTKDAVVTAIYWSLNSKFKLNKQHLLSFLSAYQKQAGKLNADEIEAGCYGLLADWLNWLKFNLSRLQNNSVESSEFLRGKTEVRKTLVALPIVFKQIPTIIKIILNF